MVMFGWYMIVVGFRERYYRRGEEILKRTLIILVCDIGSDWVLVDMFLLCNIE